MAHLDFAFLAHSALQDAHTGLFSVLGAGFDRVDAPGKPALLVLTFVARVRWEEHELDRSHLWNLTVQQETAPEPLMTVTGSGTPARKEDSLPWPMTSSFVIPTPLQLELSGTYVYTLLVGGQPLALVPLFVGLPD